MIARYDSEARSLAVDLAADAHHLRTHEVAAYTIVGIRDEHAVSVEVYLVDCAGLDRTAA